MLRPLTTLGLIGATLFGFGCTGTPTGPGDQPPEAVTESMAIGPVVTIRMARGTPAAGQPKPGFWWTATFSR